MTALKPCPACGGEAELVLQAPEQWVRCMSRPCVETSLFSGHKKPVALWNSLPRRGDKPDDERRFRAAIAAMQGLLASGLDHGVAPAAIFHADALLAELAKGEG